VEASPENNAPFGIGLRRFTKLADARERGLVLSAFGVTHAISRDAQEWVIWVAPEDAERALSDLLAYEAELREQYVPEEEELVVKVSFWSVPLVALVMVGFAVLQAENGEAWRESGILASELVVGRGQWWRIVTALTLHGDVPHVVANLGAGLIFGALLIPAFGQGLAWFLVLISGATGNALTAWTYFPQDHRTLGASTAVFGALGLLGGDALGRILQRRAGRSWWVWMLPLGAGVALLAFLGAGEGKANVDVLAHLWGFAVGLPLAVGLASLHPNQRHPALQWSCGLGSVALLSVAWVLTCRR
jgi:membrane associated rhomboid family serine protease